MSIDRKKAQVITEQIMEAIAPIIENSGLDFAPPRSKYGIGYEFKITATELELNAHGLNTNTPEAQDFLGFPQYYGLPPEALGVTFTTSNGDFVFLGTRSRASKRPVLAKKVSDGKQYVFSKDICRVIAAAAGVEYVPWGSTGAMVQVPPPKPGERIES